ncbi:hypothetical protein MI353_13635, partial [Alteromonas sp. MCA-1]|nr:hypothetical protein [Alteromonas sp. MCA-1]
LRRQRQMCIRDRPTSMRDPYANLSDCEADEGIVVSQIKDKAALLNATQFKGKNIAVTANGIKTLNLK